MAIHETKRQTDIEKRLRLLRRQVYGKASASSDVISTTAGTITHKSDLSFLYKDLSKIALFAAIAFGTQLVLFFTLFERG